MNRFLLLILPLALCVAAPALAQPNPAMLENPGVTKPKVDLPRKSPAPPALPGARAEPSAVVPPSKNVGDLPPTEALFDAVNRGDLASAKDAVNRGADIDAKNILGLTPLELSVDLGRNQISFLLLSLRGNAGYSTTSGPAATRPAKPPTRAERLAAARETRAERVTTRRPAVESAPAPPQTARLFLGGGGAPVPQAGFLGFDAGR